MSKKLTDKQILKKAMDKAVKNGWKMKGDISTGYWKKLSDSKKLLFCNSWIYERQYLWIIFSHNFAQKFWGNKIMRMGIEMGTERGEIIELESWQYHFQQMVLKKDKLKYIEKFL